MRTRGRGAEGEIQVHTGLTALGLVGRLHPRILRGQPRHQALVLAEREATLPFPWVPAADLWDPKGTRSKTQAAKR